MELISISSFSSQPLASVAITEYIPLLVIDITFVLSPVFQVYESKPDKHCKNIKPPSHKTSLEFMSKDCIDGIFILSVATQPAES